MKNIFKRQISRCISMLTLFYAMVFLFSCSNVEIGKGADILLEDNTLIVNESTNVIIDLYANDINIPEDAWLLFYTHEILTATTVGANFIDFDHNEYGGIY